MMKKIKGFLGIVLCLLVLFALGSVSAETAKDMPEAPTGFKAWGYSEDYVILWFDQSDYNYEWKGQYRILLLKGQDDWTDVTDQCISYWTGNEIYYKHSFREGEKITLAVAAYQTNADQTMTLGEKVTAPAFTYKTGSFSPIKNLRAKIENGTLYCAWDHYPSGSLSGFDLRYYSLDVCRGDGSTDEIGNPALIISSGPRLSYFTTESIEFDHSGDKLIVRLSLSLHTGEVYYYPNASLAQVELRKGSDGRFAMYRDGQYVDTTGMEFEPKTDINQVAIEPIEDQVYTGKALKPKVTLSFGGGSMDEGYSYTLSYKNNKLPGTATVTIQGIGNFTGTVEKTFRILPKAVKSPSLTAGKKKLTVSWKFDKKNEYDGYEIEYSLKKNFKGAETVTVKKAKTTEAVIKKLKKGKTYYVRIRTWKKVEGKKYYSEWSKMLKAKVK